MNTTTFMKFAYAIICISRNQFTLLERTGFEHISDGGPYVWVWDLPGWETPNETKTMVPVGSSWFVLSQDVQQGLQMVRNHRQTSSSLTRSATSSVVYAILTLGQVVLCKASGVGLVWTQSEKLFDGTTPASDTAIDMILWAANASGNQPQQTIINRLPVEIQDRILYHATTSCVASARLGCELRLGSNFTWVDRGVKIDISESKSHRSESSPVESHIVLNGVKSGLAYKRTRGYEKIHLNRTLPRSSQQAVGHQRFIPGRKVDAE